MTFKVTQGHCPLIAYWCHAATYDFLLAFLRNYIFILYRFQDTVTYLLNFKEVRRNMANTTELSMCGGDAAFLSN